MSRLDVATARRRLVVPMKQLMGDFPFAVPLGQREHVGSAGIGARQLSGPAFDFQVNDSDALDDFNARKAGTDIRCRTILSDPLEYVFNRAGIFDPLTVARDGCARMESRPHQISVTSPGRGNVAEHGAGDRVMLDEVSICWFERDEVLGSIEDFR